LELGMVSIDGTVMNFGDDYGKGTMNPWLLGPPLFDSSHHHDQFDEALLLVQLPDAGVVPISG
jgi:hypothetical protein